MKKIFLFKRCKYFGNKIRITSKFIISMAMCFSFLGFSPTQAEEATEPSSDAITAPSEEHKIDEAINKEQEAPMLEEAVSEHESIVSETPTEPHDINETETGEQPSQTETEDVQTDITSEENAETPSMETDTTNNTDDDMQTDTQPASIFFSADSLPLATAASSTQTYVLENENLKRNFELNNQIFRTVSIENKRSNETLQFAPASKEFMVQFRPDTASGEQSSPIFTEQSDDRNAWTITTTSEQNDDSAHREGPISYSLDNRLETIWHSRYSAGKGTLNTMPISVTLAFPQPKEISTLIYVPRQNGTNGDIKDYKIYIKTNGKGDFRQVSQGSLPAFQDRGSKFISLDATYQNVKEIKLEILSSQTSSQHFATAAEFDVTPKTIQQLREEDEARKSRNRISLNQLTVKANGITLDTTDGNQKMTVEFDPYEIRNTQVELKYVIELKKDAAFTQSYIEIKVPESEAQRLAIDTIDLQTFLLEGTPHIEDFSNQKPISEMSGFRGFYAGLGQPVYIDSFYTGSEFPLALNHMEDNNHLLVSRYYTGKTLSALKMNHNGYYKSWNTVIGVARSKDYQVVQQDFYKYISQIGQKSYYRKQYNSWFDYMKDITADNIQISFDEIEKGFTEGGIAPLDSFVVDDGWQDMDTLWGFNRKFPNKLYDSSKQAQRLGSNFGLWLGPQGGYTEMGRLASALVRLNKGSRHAGVVYIGDKRYVDGLNDLYQEYEDKFGINYWKLDGLLLNPRSDTDPDGNFIGGGLNNMYSMTESHERWIGLYETIRQHAKDPDKMWINLTSYIPPSPWFLQWVNSIWMQNSADVDYQDHVKSRDPQSANFDFGNDAQEAITYRDDRYEELVNTRKWQLPFANIYNHDPVYGNRAHESKNRGPIHFSTDDLRTYLYMLGTRGTGFWEFYYSYRLMDEEKWQVNGEAVNWIEQNYETLKNARFHGGKPGHGQVYGYSAWDENNGIVSFRNPINRQQTYTLTLDRLVGLPESISNMYRKTILGDKKHDTENVTNYGDTVTLTLEPYETVIFQYSKQQDTNAPELLKARVILEENKNKITLQFDEHIVLDDTTNFTVSNHAVTNKKLNADLRTVTLTLDGEVHDHDHLVVHYENVKDNAAPSNLAQGDVEVVAYNQGRILDIAAVKAGEALPDSGVSGIGEFSVTAKTTLNALNQTLAKQGNEWSLSVDADGKAVFNVKGLEVKSAPFTQLKPDDNGTADELITAGKEVIISASRQANGSLRIYVNGQVHNTVYDKTKINENLTKNNVVIAPDSFNGTINRFILENKAFDFKSASALIEEIAPKEKDVPADVAGAEASSSNPDDGGLARNPESAYDENPSTYWASSPNKDNTQEPQTLTLELAEPKEVISLYYIPRQIPNAVGNIKKLFIEYSDDKATWHRATLKNGNPDNTQSLDAANIYRQSIEIEPATAKYFRLTALETAHWKKSEENKVVAAAEFGAIYHYVPVIKTPLTLDYLRSLIEYTDTLNLDDYVDRSQEGLSDTLHNAREALLSLTQAEIDEHYNLLAQAVGKLEKKIVKIPESFPTVNEKPIGVIPPDSSKSKNNNKDLAQKTTIKIVKATPETTGKHKYASPNTSMKAETLPYIIAIMLAGILFTLTQYRKRKS